MTPTTLTVIVMTLASWYLAVCRVPIALPPYGKVTASSEKSPEGASSCQANDAYIITNKAWCAKLDNSKLRNIDRVPILNYPPKSIFSLNQQRVPSEGIGPYI